MSHTIETSTQKMRADSNEIRDMAAQYNSLQQDLFVEGRELDATWEGDSSMSFANRLKSDEPRFAELFQVVNQYCEAVDESAADYDKTESLVADNMKQNKIRQSN